MTKPDGGGSADTGDSRTDESCASPGQYPGIRNKTLSQLIFLKRQLVIEFIAEQHGVDYSEWWMTIGESESESENDSRFGEYLEEDVTAEDVQGILERYAGCESKRKAYDYLNTLRELESA